MIPFETPLEIVLDGQPVAILGTDTGSYVAADGRTWLHPETPGEDAATVQTHIEDAIANPPVDLAATQAHYDAETETLLDQRAAAWGYVSMERAVGYANSTNPQWAAEAAALIAHRDAVWTAGFSIAQAVYEEQRPVPALADYLAELPAAPERPVAP